MPGFDTLTNERTDKHTSTHPVDTDSGDHDLFAHYVTKAALEKAIFDGVPTLALCGKLWLPTKDATRYPVCPECKEIWDSMGEW